MIASLQLLACLGWDALGLQPGMQGTGDASWATRSQISFPLFSRASGSDQRGGSSQGLVHKGALQLNA